MVTGNWAVSPSLPGCQGGRYRVSWRSRRPFPASRPDQSQADTPMERAKNHRHHDDTQRGNALARAAVNTTRKEKEKEKQKFSGARYRYVSLYDTDYGVLELEPWGERVYSLRLQRENAISRCRGNIKDQTDGERRQDNGATTNSVKM